MSEAAERPLNFAETLAVTAMQQARAELDRRADRIAHLEGRIEALEGALTEIREYAGQHRFAEVPGSAISAVHAVARDALNPSGAVETKGDG